MGNSTKELVNAFNLNNYGVGNVNTNFTVEGKKIVGLFASGTNTKEYLRRIGEEIIKQHYSDGTEVASEYYNLNYFPFVLGANPDKEDLGNGIVKVKLADSTDNGVIRNLKVHFANDFEGAVRYKVAALLQKSVGITKEQAYESINGTVGTVAIGSPYLYCIAFSNEYLEKRYNPRIFELLKSLYIREFNSRLEACGLKSSDFYDNKDGMLYIKNVSDKVIKSVTEYVKKEVALDFRTPGSIESKVENYKNVLNDLIFESTGKSIYGYDYDDFTDEKKIRNGSSFALIPFIKENGQLKSLSSRDASKINGVFNKEIPNVDDNFISDIKGKTANPQFANCKEPVYAFSNKQIALLLPKIMESPIAYNQINGHFEFAVDLENFRSQHGSLSPEPPRTPPEQTGRRFLKSKGDRDSGLGDSPPQHSVACSSSGSPSSSLEQSNSIRAQPRRGSGKGEEKGGSEVLPLRNYINSVRTSGRSLTQTSCPTGVPGVFKSLSAQARTSTGGPYPPPPPLIPFSSPQFLLSVARPSSSKGANESGSATGNPYPLPPPPRSSLISLLVSGPRLRLPFARPSPRKGANESGSASTSAPNSLSFSGPRFQPYSRSTSRCSTDSGCPRSPGLLTNERSASVYSAESGYESRPSSTFTDTSNYENQEELTEKELIINKFLKNVKEIAAKNIEEKKTLKKEKIHEYIEGFAKLEKADKPYQYCISFDEEYFKSKESSATRVFGIFKDNYIAALSSELNRGGLENSDFCEYKNDKLYIKDIIDINVIKKVAENAHMPDGKSSPKWTEQRAKADTNKPEDVPPLSEEEGLIKALLYRFNSSNYYRGGVHINFTLKNGKIVSLLGDHVNTTEYLDQVKNYIIEHDCGTEEVAKRVYNFGQFPCVFPSDFQRDKDGKIIIAYNIDDAIPNLKVHLIQDFRIQVEEEVVKKLEKMGVKEARKRIKESAYLATKSKNSDVWYVFFDSKRFQEKSKLFEEFKSIYVEAFKSRWKECGLDDSLVYYENDALYIKNAIDINVVKSIEKYEKEEYRKLQASCGYSPKEASCSCFPSEEVLAETPIAFNEGLYFLERDFGEDMDYEESFDRGNTGRKSLKRKSPSPEDEGSSRESSGSESSNSSSKSDRKNTERKSLKRKSPSPEEARDPPRSSFSDSDSELCSSLQEAKI
ncbi:hypothetical protein [Wolbachia endosymbiont (group A) of Agelastica alni]|uniref:hypothetical protein n=1 Tax=Wolbachia endosymbiont (group A) of Agelastica alni TaxID=3066130 RepID=UPI0031331562